MTLTKEVKKKAKEAGSYAAENPCATDAPEEVSTLEKKLVKRPVPNSYIE
jgi:hypothetical protein